MDNIKDILIILNEMLVKINKIENDMHEIRCFNYEKLNSRIEDELINIDENKHKSAMLTSFTEYDRILLNNLESRLCILEEESQNYNIK